MRLANLFLPYYLYNEPESLDSQLIIMAKKMSLYDVKILSYLNQSFRIYDA